MKTRNQKKVENLVNEVNENWHLFKEREKILVGVTGTKESLALLKVLADIGLNVTTVYTGLELDKPVDFKEWCLQYGDFHVIDGKNPNDFSDTQEPCYYCERSRRTAIIKFAQEHDFGKIAFSHSREDIIENLLKDLLFKGKISVAGPKQELYGCQLMFPFYLVPGKLLNEYCETFNLSDHYPKCRYINNPQRSQVNILLKTIAEQYPDTDFHDNILTGHLNLISSLIER